MLLTSLIFVELVELYTLHEERPSRNFEFSGMSVVAALRPVR